MEVYPGNSNLNLIIIKQYLIGFILTASYFTFEGQKPYTTSVGFESVTGGATKCT